MLHEKLPERIHIRVVPYQPSMGYFIADCHDLDGFMTASPYFYDTGNRSATELADFEHQWQDARPWG
jgi:hypothetical protein